MLETAFNCEGYFDQYNLTGTELKTYETEIVTKRRKGGFFEKYTESENGKYKYEFVLTPNYGFLASPEPLLKDCELKISFDRSNWKTSITKFDDVTKPCTGLEIKDCIAIVEYVSSPIYRDYFCKIDTSPIVYKFEDCDVLIKSIPLNETEIRFDNIRGGNIPSYIFAGIIPQSCLNGDEVSSSTRFTNKHVEEFNICLNGNSVNGYPIKIKHGCPVYPMHKFLDVTGRMYNNSCGSTFQFQTFNQNFLWAYKSEAEESSQGWTSINFKITEGFDTPHNLIVWIISETALAIDKFHQIEKINF